MAVSAPTPSRSRGSTTLSRVITKEELCLLERVPEACGIVIFGASGDLAHRKLFPALFHLYKEKVLPKNFFVVGVARTVMSDQAFRDKIAEHLPNEDSAKQNEFLKHCTYQSGDYKNEKTYGTLSQNLEELDRLHQTGGRRLFYLSVPPELYGEIAQRLGDAGLSNPGKDAWTRLVVEKPFGYSLESAERLNREFHGAFLEKQIYRIDHYLGKETVQNIMVFRFANAIFEPLWNRNYIDHIQITSSETAGVEHRAGYYEKAGVLRDMFQNHLLQLMSLIAMEPPSSFGSEAVRDEKSKVITSLKDLDLKAHPDHAIRGQYQRGEIDGKVVVGYREEEGVANNSTTETFAALRVEIDNWRWRGVPIYMRSGKRMAERVTDILVEFKHVPASIFRPLMADQLAANRLRFRIQPNEGICLSFEAKHPGPKLCMSTVTMNFDYEESFGVEPPEAYARLFLDVMLGDPTLFARKDWLAEAWRFLDPVLANWGEKKNEGLLPYASGSWGPASVDTLLQSEGRDWC